MATTKTCATVSYENCGFTSQNIFKGHWTSNIIPQVFPKKVGIFLPLEVFAWAMTAC